MQEAGMSAVTLLAHAYFFLALLYNVASQVMLDIKGKKLAPTDPNFGILVVSVVYIIFLLRPYIPSFSYLLMILIFLASILRFGVIKHVLNYAPEDYYSRLSWFAAIAINVFGVTVLSASVILG